MSPYPYPLPPPPPPPPGPPNGKPTPPFGGNGGGGVNPLNPFFKRKPNEKIYEPQGVVGGGVPGPLWFNH